MSFPKNYLYTNEHVWLKQHQDNVYVGLTDVPQRRSDNIEFLRIETIGQTIEKGKIFGTMEVAKKVSDLFIPITGKILEVNKNIINNPELVNKDPYGEGWLVKIRIAHPSQVFHLLNFLEYKTFLSK